ncbi:MAG: glycosyltransferase family 2 protein [Bacteroidetes bacterium]|nr:MAG: glycosyltransferase family 2 protein [Bacteroidota bacterium]
MAICTVTLPVHKSPCLRLAINSILAQTFTDFIFLIAIDGDDDEGYKIVASYNDARIQLYRFPHGGFIKTVDRLARMVNTEFWARMDHDDYSHPERLEKLIGILRSNPQLAGVCSDYGYCTTNRKLVMFSDAQLTYDLDTLSSQETFIYSRRIADTSFVYRTACTKAVDFFDTNINFEQPMQIKLIEKFGLGIIPFPLHFATFSLQSVSRNSKKEGKQDSVLRYIINNYSDPNDSANQAQIRKNETKDMPKWLRLSIRKMRMELASKNYHWLWQVLFDEKRVLKKRIYWVETLKVLLGREKKFVLLPNQKQLFISKAEPQ